MNQKTKIALAILTLLVLSISGNYWLIRQNKKMFDRYNEMYDNFHDVLIENNKVIYLETEKQLAKLYPAIDSLAKKLGVKNITNVHNTYYKYYLGDTIITQLIADTTPGIFTFEIDTACINMAGIVDVTSQKLKLSYFSLSDKITTFYYRQRIRLFDWKWTPRWGRWDYSAVTHSNCTDSIRTESITIKKNVK